METDRQRAIRTAGEALQHYQRAVQAFDIAAARVLKLGNSDMRCLDLLSESPRTARELSDAIGLRPSATTALIDRLVERGFIARQQVEGDRRQVLLKLTDSGAEQIWAIYGQLAGAGALVFEGIDVEQIRAVSHLLGRMTATTNEHRQQISGAAS